MAPLLLASLAFGAGSAFLKPSRGFTCLGPSLAVVVCFLIGAILLARAVRGHGLGSTYVVGLGLEAVVSFGIGLLVLGERLSLVQGAGVLLILSGVGALRLG
jgi:small multidrug resistance pump